MSNFVEDHEFLELDHLIRDYYQENYLGCIDCTNNPHKDQILRSIKQNIQNDL
ncbi:MAG: hypothetical protein ACRCS8_03140 [Brevinema sp.]